MPWDDLQEGILADIAGWQAPQEQLAFDFHSASVAKRRAGAAQRAREYYQRIKVSDPAKYERRLAYGRNWKRVHLGQLPRDKHQPSFIERLAEARRQRRNDASRA